MILTPRLSPVQIRNLRHTPSPRAVHEEAVFDRDHPSVAAAVHTAPTADEENAWVTILKDADKRLDEFWLRQAELI